MYRLRLLPRMIKKRLARPAKAILLAHLAFLAAHVFWGAAGPVIKLTLDYIPPFTFLFLRFLVVCILILPYTMWEINKHSINKKDYLNFFLLGLFSQTAIAIAFVALKYTLVLDYTIIAVIGTVLSVYAGHYFYKDKVHPGLTIGLILATIGTFVVILEPLLSGDGGSVTIEHRIFGNLLGLLYSLTFVIYIVWSKMSMGEKSPKLKKALSFIHIKPMRHSYSPTLIVAITFYVGLFTIIPLAFGEQLGWFGDIGYFDMASIPPVAVLGVLYMAIFSSIAAYMLYQWGLEYSRVTDSALYGYLGPIFTFPFAFLLLGEIPDVYMLVGCVLIATGVIIAESKNT